MNKTILYVVLGVILIPVLVVGSILIFSNKDENKTTLTSTATSSSVVSKSDKVVSETPGVMIASEQNKFTISFKRGGSKEFNTNTLKEIKKILDQTEMGIGNQTSVLGAVGANESFYLDTKSECGFDAPSSDWCFRMSNNKETNIVTVVIQKAKFFAL